MTELTWGETLWDQWDRVQEHTENGIEFTKKCSEFVRDRIKLEQDYAKNLRRLKKQYKLKNTEEDAANFTTIKTYNVFLDQLDLIARDHEILAEGLQEKVADRLRAIHKETTRSRINLCNSATQLQQEYKEWQMVLSRHQQKYEKAAKEAELASQNFTKVNDDMNATKAQVEKSRSVMNHRQDLMEKSKGDYIIAVETTNNNQHDYYHQRWPGLLNQMQRCEETRIEHVKEVLQEHCRMHTSVLPHVTSCLQAMSDSADSINPAEDSELLMEERNNQPFPPDHQFIEYGMKPPSSSLQSFGSTRKTKRDRKKTKIFGRVGGDSSESVNKEGLENLPPEKRKKAFKEKIKEVQNQIDIQLKARGAIEEILELYSQKPELGSPSAVEESRKQLDGITTTLENLQEDLYKYQCYLAALTDKPVPEKPYLGSHLQADQVSITSSVSHASDCRTEDRAWSENRNNNTVSHSKEEEDALNQEFNTQVSSPAANEFQPDTYYEVPDNNLPPPTYDSCAAAQWTVLYNYVAQHDDELDIFEGELLEVLEDNGTGWVKARRNDNEQGLVPGNYIELLES